MDGTMKDDNHWNDYIAPPRSLQYVDTEWGNRIWRSSTGQLLLEPKPPITDINPPLDLERVAPVKKKTRGKKA